MKNNLMTVPSATPLKLLNNIFKKRNNFMSSKLHKIDAQKLNLKSKRNFYLDLLPKRPSISNDVYQMTKFDSNGLEAILIHENNLKEVFSIFDNKSMSRNTFGNKIQKINEQINEEFQKNINLLFFQGILKKFEDEEMNIYFKMLELVFFNFVLDFEELCMFRASKNICGFLVLQLFTIQRNKELSMYGDFKKSLELLRQFINTKEEFKTSMDIVYDEELDVYAEKYSQMYQDIYGKIFRSLKKI
jgi:hypothetical protein